MTPPKANSPAPDNTPPAQCQACNGTGAACPRSEVLAARRTVYGCCNRHADNNACDCLTEPCQTCNGTGRNEA